MHGDCAEVMRERMAEDSVNLIVTSPPYADQRRNTYGGIHPDESSSGGCRELRR